MEIELRKVYDLADATLYANDKLESFRAALSAYVEGYEEGYRQARREYEHARAHNG